MVLSRAWYSNVIILFWYIAAVHMYTGFETFLLGKEKRTRDHILLCGLVPRLQIHRSIGPQTTDRPV